MILFPILPTGADPILVDSEDVPSSWRFYQWNNAEQITLHTYSYKAYYQFLNVNGFRISHQIIYATAPSQLDYHCQSDQPVLTYVSQGNLALYTNTESVGTYMDAQYSLWRFPAETSLQLRCEKGEHRIFQIAFSYNLLSILLNRPVDQRFMSEEQPINKQIPVYQIRSQLMYLLKDVLRYAKKLDTFVIPLNTKLFQLVERFSRTIIQVAKSSEWNKKKSITLADLATYIQEHLDFDDRAAVSLPELARKLRTNPYQFQKLFKIQYGLSVARYIQKSRMEKAVQLLTEAALPVGAIYLQVGYSDFSSFSRAFTAYYGYAPSRLSK